jgi:hypothetical protein
MERRGEVGKSDAMKELERTDAEKVEYEVRRIPVGSVPEY